MSRNADQYSDVYKALSAADAHLSLAQGELGFLTGSSNTRIKKLANSAWDALEKVRHQLNKRR